MKKLLLMALLLVPTFSLSGCGKKREDLAFLQENLEVSLTPLTMSESFKNSLEKDETLSDKINSAVEKVDYEMLTIKNKSSEYYFNGLDVYLIDSRIKEDDENINSSAFEFKLYAQPNEEVQIPLSSEYFATAKLLDDSNKEPTYEIRVDYNSSDNKVVIEDKITKEQMEKAFSKVSKEAKKDVIYPNQLEIKDEGNIELPEELKATLENGLTFRKISITNNGGATIFFNEDNAVVGIGFNENDEMDALAVVVPGALLDNSGLVTTAGVSPGQTKTYAVSVVGPNAPTTLKFYFPGQKY